MRGLPVWILAGLAVLSGLLLWIGWDERHEAGYLPFVMGILFTLFTLAALGGWARGEDED
jgi:hypothetical protein